MSLIIYTTKDDNSWIKELYKYAEGNKWSVSMAVRELIKAYFKNETDFKVAFNEGFKETMKANTYLIKKHMTDLDVITTNGTDEIQYFDGNSNQVEAPEPIFVSEHKGMVLIEPAKIDLATFEAQNMAKLNVNQNMEACIKEHTIDGKIFCYMFDNAREYHPFCKSECWTRKDIWGKRVRI